MNGLEHTSPKGGNMSGHNESGNDELIESAKAAKAKAEEAKRLEREKNMNALLEMTRRNAEEYRLRKSSASGVLRAQDHKPMKPILDERRKASGEREVDAPELEVIVDEKGKIIGHQTKSEGN